ncbi:MAG: hypothetical protein OES79_15745, partial [Planctomycetota bacterium]|nr:hypothetical protein [Planctomycetota bacterium]
SIGRVWSGVIRVFPTDFGDFLLAATGSLEIGISQRAFLRHAVWLQNYAEHGRNATCKMLPESFAAGQSS